MVLHPVLETMIVEIGKGVQQVCFALHLTPNDHAMALFVGSALVDCKISSRMCSARNLTTGTTTPSPMRP